VLTVRTPAKINPVLEVLGPRPDGFHELALVFQAIGLYDQLSFEKKSSGVELKIEGSAHLAVDDSNLVVKAAKLFLREVLRDSGGVKVTLRKKIPMAAGLGGGSSDAAATLMGLNWLYETDLSDSTMNAMAAGLGSDVNFFLTGGAALGTGRGEMITPWKDTTSLPILLIKPPQGLSTPAVYRSGKASLTSGQKAKNFKTLLAQGDMVSISSHLFNGLEPAAFYLRPEVELIKKRLIQEGALGALLSGSGPTVFGIFSDMAQAKAASQKFEGEDFEIVVTQTISTGVEKR
jgi:4-diphosphocytidyl-2-C-methyl-D-erythritol kinase